METSSTERRWRRRIDLEIVIEGGIGGEMYGNEDGDAF
jgi:hypothetical protein